MPSTLPPKAGRARSRLKCARRDRPRSRWWYATRGRASNPRRYRGYSRHFSRPSRAGWEWDSRSRDRLSRPTAAGFRRRPGRAAAQPSRSPFRCWPRRTAEVRIAATMREQTKVAIIDDDESIRKSLVRILGAAGLEVAAFASAHEFLAAAESGTVSCVVSDLRMPGVDGLEFQRALHARQPYLSVVFITGHGDVPSSVTAMKAGAVDFLEKPVRRGDLLSAINR